MSAASVPGGSVRRPRRTGMVALVLGAVLVSLIVIVCLVSLFWTPYDPSAMSPADRFAAPSAEHPMGCDHFGRDVLSRVMVASQVALLVGVISVVCGALVGTVLGSLAALASTGARAVIMRLVDGLMAFPGILLAMMLVLVLGRGLVGACVAIAIFMVPTFARLSYQLVMETLSRTYVKAARSYGTGPARLAVVQIIPAILPRLLTQLSSSMGAAMLLEASLSFLGLGVQPPQSSWGLMASEAMSYVYTYPWQVLPAGLVLVLAVLGFNLLGDGLSDRLARKGGR